MTRDTHPQAQEPQHHPRTKILRPAIAGVTAKLLAVLLADRAGRTAERGSPNRHSALPQEAPASPLSRLIAAQERVERSIGSWPLMHESLVSRSRTESGRAVAQKHESNSFGVPSPRRGNAPNFRAEIRSALQDFSFKVESLIPALENEQRYVAVLGGVVRPADMAPLQQTISIGNGVTQQSATAVREAIWPLVSREHGEGRGLRIIHGQDLDGSAAEMAGEAGALFVIESRLELEPTISVSSWGLATRRSSSGYSPLLLRRSLAILRARLVDQFIDDDQDALVELLALDDINRAVKRAASLAGGEAAVLWYFNFETNQFKSDAIHGFNPVSPDKTDHLHVTAQMQDDDGNRVGIVGHASPEHPFLVYDRKRRSSWQPSHFQTSKWSANEPSVFSKLEMRSALVVPIVSEARMVGALSIYSKKPATKLGLDRRTRALLNASFHGYLTGLSDRRNLEKVEESYSAQLRKFSMNSLALARLHDLEHIGENLLTQIGQLELEVDAARGLGDGVEKALKDLTGTAEKVTTIAQKAKDTSKQSNETGFSRLDIVLAENEEFLRLHADQIAQSANKYQPTFTIDSSPPDSLSAREDWAEVPIPSGLAESLVFNLVTNAAYWSQHGRTRKPAISLSLTAENIDEIHGAHEVVLRVSDNGYGMAVNELEHIFERFVSHRSGGAGIGLHMVRRWCREASGSATATCPSGRVPETGRTDGARFVIRLPFGRKVPMVS